MKWLPLFLLLPLCAIAAPKHAKTPAPAATAAAAPNGAGRGPVTKTDAQHTEWVCRTKQQDLELRDWIGGTLNQLHQAQAENQASAKTNAVTEAKLKDAEATAARVISECAADKACAKSPFTCGIKRLFKHILWILAGVVVLCVGLSLLGIAVPWLRPILDFFLGIFRWVVQKFTPKPKP